MFVWAGSFKVKGNPLDWYKFYPPKILLDNTFKEITSDVFHIFLSFLSFFYPYRHKHGASKEMYKNAQM